MYNSHLRTTEVVPQFCISSSFRARVQQWGGPSGALYTSKYILFLKVWKHGLVSWPLPWLLCNFLPDKWSGEKGNSQVVFPFLWLSGAELLSGILASRQNSGLGSRNMTLRCSGVRFLLAVLCLGHTHLATLFWGLFVFCEGNHWSHCVVMPSYSLWWWWDHIVLTDRLRITSSRFCFPSPGWGLRVCMSAHSQGTPTLQEYSKQDSKGRNCNERLRTSPNFMDEEHVA